MVQTLHNFAWFARAVCSIRNGETCEDCLGNRTPWPGVLHGCYRGSRLGSAVVGAMITTHRAIRTWSKHVDAYIALNGFVRAKLIEAGLDAEKDSRQSQLPGGPPRAW